MSTDEKNHQEIIALLIDGTREISALKVAVAEMNAERRSQRENIERFWARDWPAVTEAIKENQRTIKENQQSIQRIEQTLAFSRGRVAGAVMAVSALSSVVGAVAAYLIDKL